MEIDGLPRSYLIKQCRNEMNDICHVQRTPGDVEGAEIDIHAELSFAVKDMIRQNPNTQEKPRFMVKFCGDGTDISRNKGLVIMSFSLFCRTFSVDATHHLVARVRGNESYELYEKSFNNVWKTINELYDSKKIDVDGTEYELIVRLSGDYKFLLIVLGLGKASSIYACIYCKVKACDRGDTSQPENYYNEGDLVRTLESISSDCRKKLHSCLHSPLTNIELKHIVCDELHMMLRITDRLFENLITDAADMDNKQRHLSGVKSLKDENSCTSKLVAAIRACGVYFNIYERLDSAGNSSGKLECTSLLGNERKKVMKLLPEKLMLANCLHPDSGSTVIRLWKCFADFYFKLCGLTSSEEMTNASLFNHAKLFIDTFLSLEGVRKGYERSRVTPYMHVMLYHMPRLVQDNCGITQFSGQGMEKANDRAKTIHQNRSNKSDSCTAILKNSSRQNRLKYLGRTPRTHTKRDDMYWRNLKRPGLQN